MGRIFSVLSLSKKFMGQSGGAVVILFAVAAIPVMLALGVALDFSRGEAAERRMQAALDSAALAASASHDLTEEQRIALAQDVFAQNYPGTDNGIPTVPNVTISGDDVTVTGDVALDTAVMALGGLEQLAIEGMAVARRTLTTTACILALSPTSEKALWLDSNADLDLTGCEVVVNSVDDQAFLTDSNSNAASDRNCVAGQHSQGGSSTVAPAAEEGCDPVADPYASLPAPSTSGCDYNDKVVDNQTVTLDPGKYCNGLEIKNNAIVTFSSGVYVIMGKPFKVDSNAHITGSDVMFYLATGSNLLIDANSAVTLSAPTSGTYSGILFFQAPTNTNQAFFSSNSVNQLTGVLYFPQAKIKFDSNTQMTSAGTCTEIVGWEIEFSSNAGLDMDFDHSTCPSGVKKTGGGIIALVE